MAISGPIALYSNVPIKPQYYQPSRFQISDIMIGETTVITTLEDMNYVISQQIRVLVPEGYGCRQINNLSAYVLAILSPNSVEISINSSNFDAFLNISLSQVPQIVAIGNIENGQINLSNKSMGTFTPGSFINISPN